MVLIEHRVTNDRDHCEMVVHWASHYNKVIMACFELSKKGVEHMHMVLDTDKTVSTYRQKFVDQFPYMVGNKSYKISPVLDLERKLRYICKGTQMFKPDVIAGDVNEANNLYNQFWEENAKLLSEGVKQTHQKLKSTRTTFMQEVKDEFQKRYPKFTPNYNKNDLEILTLFLCKRLGKAVKILDEIILKRMVLGLLNSLNDDSKLPPSLFAKMFPDFADDKFCFLDGI